MIAYLDASALATLLLRDAGAERIAVWIAERDAAPAVGDFCLGETASAIAIRFRRDLLTRDQARALLEDIGSLTSEWQRADLQGCDIADATALVARLDLALRLPDAIHIAVARRIGATLVTVDRQQARAAAALGLSAIDPLEGPAAP